MLYGTSKVITEHLNKKEKYSEVKKVYSITIAYFDLGQGSDYVYYGKTEFTGIHNQELLTLSEKQMELFQKNHAKGIPLGQSRTFILNTTLSKQASSMTKK